jgi:hypothetical protein
LVIWYRSGRRGAGLVSFGIAPSAMLLSQV